MTIKRAADALEGSYEGSLGVEDGWGYQARAALEAIAEPTPEMIEAGEKAPYGIPYIWRAMHAAMLKETK